MAKKIAKNKNIFKFNTLLKVNKTGLSFINRESVFQTTTPCGYLVRDRWISYV